MKKQTLQSGMSKEREAKARAAKERKAKAWKEYAKKAADELRRQERLERAMQLFSSDALEDTKAREQNAGALAQAKGFKVPVLCVSITVFVCPERDVLRSYIIIRSMSTSISQYLFLGCKCWSNGFHS